VVELSSQSIESAILLDRKLREIQMDISFLCTSLNEQATDDGIAHLKGLLLETLELLRKVAVGVLNEESD